MDKVLAEIAEIVQEYNKMGEFNIERLNHLLKNLTTRLYYLETLRSNFHNKFEHIVFERTKEGEKVARATNFANKEVPELYKLRRIMDAGCRISDAIRTNISYLKQEIK